MGKYVIYNLITVFTHCTFKKCKTLGVRVRLKDCKDYKDELEGQYNIIKDDNDNNEQSE